MVARGGAAAARELKGCCGFALCEGEAVLRKLGFNENWIKLVMSCVSSVTYSVLLNGKPGGKVIPTRGLRQGDPISPYLFILCAEGLSSLLNYADQKGEIMGVAVAKGGQVLNKEKSSLFFSSNTEETEKKMILFEAGGVVCGSYEKYLGLPAMVGRSKYKTFRGVKEKVWKKIKSWKNSFLSLAGKEVLIKAVLQAIPSYTMGVFKLPISLCKELNSLYSKFWWGHKENSKKIHWWSWERLGVQKARGGMGFRDVECFNAAMLAKQGWRMIKNSSSLVAQVYRDKYFKNSEFLKAKLGINPSYIWRSVLSARDLLKEGLQWRVGNGNNIGIWGEKWLPTPISKCVQSPMKRFWEDMKVNKLIVPSTNSWDEDLIRGLFKPEEAEVIVRIPLSRRGSSNVRYWGYTKYGNGGASSGQNPLCPICGRDEETVIHILWSCPSSVDVWAKPSSPVHKCATEEVDFLELWSKLMNRLQKGEMEWVATIMHRIWLRRNKVVFENQFYNPSKLLQMAGEGLEDYKLAQISQEGSATTVDTADYNVMQKKWKKPGVFKVKANWDAALDMEAKRMGMGIVIRDEEGEVLVSVCDVRNHVDHPAIAESWALWKALEICNKLALSRVTFEGDAVVVINGINREVEDQSCMGHITEDIKQVFKAKRDWNIRFVPKDGNKVAHMLAKYVLELGEEKI
ncbi:uncharacterized protein LOC121244278 [Juglans microcarpa x Juglans regia]|uniref:uncharacterized protein LOC121244278 n=1 Tax=Juglans microcarpa x Juglans regia TaxID=2249226 RepID=UPI001B7ECD62|nr:uncharacterized protein LOC121244278 [Juglans microcarpa x Juglans regia]